MLKSIIMNDLSSIANLDELWNYTNKLHKQHYPESTLEPIMAGGNIHKPKYMFVFINPTYKNISADSAWKGRRRPWTGTRYIWKIFNDAGHFDDDLLEEIKKRRAWDIEFAEKVYKHLENRGFYFTNIVKWTGENVTCLIPIKQNYFYLFCYVKSRLFNLNTLLHLGLSLFML